MSILIQGRLKLYKKKISCDVKLSTKVLSYSYERFPSNSVKRPVVECFNVCDIVGCACMKSVVNDDHCAYIKIYVYPLITKKRRSKRLRKIVIFEVSKEDSLEKNLLEADKWRDLINSAVDCSFMTKPISDCAGPSMSHSTHVDESSFSPLCSRRKLLILLNPRSGPGFAEQFYYKIIEPLIFEAEIGYEYIKTEYAQQAYEIVQSLKLENYAGIVVVAGDGLLYEVYNGLLQRSDIGTALSTPVGIIPGGSGNGLARSIAYHIGESQPYMANPILTSTLNIINFVPAKMDLILIHRPDGKKLVSFLSLSYGIMADIDLESDILRSLGETRFFLWTVARLTILKKYRVRLSFKRAIIDDTDGPSSGKSLVQTSTRKNLRRSYENVYHSSSSKEERARPKSMSMIYDEENTLDSTTDTTLDSQLVHVVPAKAEGESLENTEGSSITGSETLDNCMIAEDALENPVPSDWETIEDDFVNIFATTQPFISSTYFISPKSTFDDGVMWLVLLNGTVSRANIAKFLLSIESGTHMNVPGVSFFPVTGVRIVPLSSKGKVNIDGEWVEFGPLHATILKQSATVMTRRK